MEKEHPKRVIALEMGGNNPLICSQVNDIDAAVYNTIQSAYVTSGQRCTCARRLIVTNTKESNKFINKLINVVSKIKVAHFTNIPEPFMGPVISTSAAKEIIVKEQELLLAGAKSLLPMKQLDSNLALLSPGLIDVTDVLVRKDEEIFGPLLQVIRVPDFESAIIEANNTNYGLSAGLFTNNRTLYQEFYYKVKAGIINWNRPLTGSNMLAPFGGVGVSGNHRPSSYYAADYCAHPVSSLEDDILRVPDKKTPGIFL